MRRSIPILLVLVVGVACALTIFSPDREPATVVDCLELLREGSGDLTVEEKARGVYTIEFDGADLEDPIRAPDFASLSLSGLRQVKQEENALSFEVTRSDHWIKLEFDPPIQARDVTCVALSASSTVSSDRPRLYFAAAGQALDLSRSLPFDFVYDERMHGAVISVEDSRAWVGEIATLALRFPYLQAQLDTTPATLKLGPLYFFHTANPLVASRLRSDWTGEDLGNGVVELLPRAKIGNEIRPALYASAPARFECDVEVPDNARLDVDFGILESAWNKPGDGVTFSVSVDAGEEEERLWSRTVDPKARAEDGRWHGARVDLSGYEGKKVTLLFETFPGNECVPSGDGAYDYAVWSNIDLFPLEEEPPPSLILVCLDTLRPDRLGCYGYDRDTSPNLDALAKKGVLFENAISQAPETLAAHMSLFTGLYPREHHVWDVQKVADGTPYLVEAFRARGYRTAAFTEDGGVASIHGFDRGFQIYHDGAVQGQRGGKLVEETFGMAAEFVRRHRDRPFFLFLHTYETHTPYDPPPAVREPFVGDYSGPVEPPVSWAKMYSLLLGMRERPLTEADFGFVSDLYDAGIRHVDAELAKFLAVVDEAGLGQSSYRLVFSDHGEDFWDHFGFATHGHSLYEEMVRVPLLVLGPDVAAGARVPDQVQLLDVIPTLLDRLDLPLPDDRISGHSFADLLQGGSVSHRPAYAEDHTLFERLMVRTEIDGKDYKLIHSPGIEQHPMTAQIRDFLAGGRLDRFTGILKDWELYCLTDDPGETRNLFQESPTREALEALLEAFLRDHPLGEAGEPADRSQDVENRLEELGYTLPGQGGQNGGQNPQGRKAPGQEPEGAAGKPPAGN